jgi:hypothetical protein
MVKQTQLNDEKIMNQPSFINFFFPISSSLSTRFWLKPPGGKESAQQIMTPIL